MKLQTKAALEQISRLDRSQWEALDGQAADRAVGGSRWEEAWLAATAGHAAGSRAYYDAIAHGASVRAAAGVAGAVAAVEAGGSLTLTDYRVLLGGGSFGFLGGNPRRVQEPVVELAGG